MSRQIKNIEISDFRGFEGTKTLDFEDANLILFLGLNGFGKTSIFDAVEWCLTGKIGRYETYLEGGRKQDFGKEKEVLRNKYATQPNTFVKLHLNDGKKFGRRILSSENEADYNTGSIIDDFEFGPASICREQVSSELVNNYFSATHLLSQETIHHFVTSKKPEDRYRALSVNFGTALFTPFESNMQNLITQIDSKEAKTQDEITSVDKFLKEWKEQERNKTKDIEKTIITANTLVESLNKIFDRQQFSEFVLNDHEISLTEGLEELLKKMLRDLNQELALNEQKTKTAAYLFNEHQKWTAGNAQLKKLEDEIESTRKALLYVQELVKNSQKFKLELNNTIESREKALARKNKVKFISERADHYLKSLKAISSKEEEIAKLLKQDELDRKASPDVKAKISQLQAVIDSQSLNILKSSQLKSELLSGEAIVRNHVKEAGALRGKISFNSNAIREKKSENQIIDSIIRVIEGGDPSKSMLASILTLQGAEDNIGKEALSKITNHITELEKIHLAHTTLEEKKIDIEKLQKLERETLSAKRKVVADSLALIDRNISNCECPVCKTEFQTEKLISVIEQQLNDSVSKKITTLNADYSKTVEGIEDNSRLLAQTRQQIGRFLRETITASQGKKALNNEMLGKLQHTLRDAESSLESLENTYSGLIAKVATHTGEQKYNYDEILLSIEKQLVTAQEALKPLNLEIEKLKKDFDIITGRMEESQKLLKHASAEIEGTKDSTFKEVHEFLIENGISFNSADLAPKIGQMLSLAESEIERREVELKKATEESDDVEVKIKSLPKDQTETELLKRQSEHRSVIENLKEEIRAFSEKCELIGITPGEYKVSTINKIQKSLASSAEMLKCKFEIFQSLSSHVEQFLKFNENKNVRKRVEEYENKIQVLEQQKSLLKKAKDGATKLRREFPKALKDLLVENLDVDLFNTIYRSLSPHRRFQIIDFDVDVNRNKVGIHFNAKHSKINARPEFLFSSAQLNTFGICMFLSMALRQNWLDLDSILIDDPIQNLDDINVLSFIDFVRGLLDSKTRAKQIILSTHDERFYDLMIRKFQGYKVKAFKFESYGKIIPDPRANHFRG